MRKLVIILLFATVSVAISCKKDANTFKKVNATVIFAGGDPAANGCGYLIQLDNGTNYYPVNLADAYKKYQLKVIVDYHRLTTNYQCGSFLPSNGVQEVNIDGITTR